jgi:hypothetical protein
MEAMLHEVNYTSAKHADELTRIDGRRLRPVDGSVKTYSEDRINDTLKDYNNSVSRALVVDNQKRAIKTLVSAMIKGEWNTYYLNNVTDSVQSIYDSMQGQEGYLARNPKSWLKILKHSMPQVRKSLVRRYFELDNQGDQVKKTDIYNAIIQIDKASAYDSKFFQVHRQRVTA